MLVTIRPTFVPMDDAELEKLDGGLAPVGAALGLAAGTGILLVAVGVYLLIKYA